jgi:hypothetical protein
MTANTVQDKYGITQTVGRNVLTTKLTEEEHKEFEEALLQFRWGIEYIQKAIKTFPKLISQDIAGDSSYTYESLAKMIADSTEDLKKFEENIKKKHQEIIDTLDTIWNSIGEKHYQISEKIKSIKERKLDFDTYKMTNILELVEKLDRIDPESWKRFETICQKLKD